jgi:hypothetical protein
MKEEIDIDGQIKQRRKLINNIEFLLSHLDISELKAVQATALSLCKTNSQSYTDWWNKANGQ